ncbi:uncharacterized protein LOC128395102 [Panonychus citri]|uniref:uncharacterized protein LOC128395102 n=1 Tax=Panonychus citri TaxID=50023 RepID=UPI002306FAF3|nr:uncharacterized protein LOC128395102 [Panonychus citri]
MEDDWNATNASPDPKLIAFQKKMENLQLKNGPGFFISSKQKKKTNQDYNNHFKPVSPSSVFRKCYLILSIFASKYTNYYGHVWRPELVSPDYDICGTPKEMNKFTKLTVTANHPDKLQTAHQNLLYYTRKLNYQNSRNSTKINLIDLPEKHCSLCFRFNHTKINCEYCSYCSEPGHFRKNCPELPFKTDQQVNINTVVQSRPTKYSYAREQRRVRRRKLREAYGGKPFWKNLNNPIPEHLEKYVPIGPKNNKKETLSLDIEGDGNNGVGSVHLSGWFGNVIRIQTVYYAQVKNTTISNPNTRITGLQINDLATGLSLDEICQQVRELAIGRRLLTQGKDDLNKLELTTSKLKASFIQHVDLQDLWPGQQPIGLVSLDKFLFFNHQKLRRDDDKHVTIGHSPERDSRVTLKAYIELQKMKDKNIPVPTAEVVRDMVKMGQNIHHWLQLHSNNPIEIITLD